MRIQEAIIQATREVAEGPLNKEKIDGIIDSAIAYRAADILGCVQHDVVEAVLSAMDKAKPAIRDAELEAWRRDGVEFATQPTEGTEHR